MAQQQITGVIAEVIAIGILRIRSAGWAGDAALCAIEADHIHNLPHLLQHFSDDLLKFYWEIERPAYERHIAAHSKSSEIPLDTVRFHQVWQEIERYRSKSSGSGA